MIKIKILILTLFLLTFIQSQAQTIFPVPKYPYETCIVDYDLDGDNDIVVGCSGPNQDPDSIVFFINDGWGNFESEKYPANINGYLYCIDLTNDGFPDIISRNVEDGIFFYENDHTISIGTTYFIKDTYGNPFIGGIADINLDGTNDILFYDITVPWGWGVAFNNGDNTFTDSLFLESNETLQMSHSGDLNNDNNPDILITTLDQSESARVLYNYYPDFTEQVIATPDWNRGYVLNANDDGLNDIMLFKLSVFGDFPLVNLINEGGYFLNCDTLYLVNGSDIKNICDYNLDGYDDFSTAVYQANNHPIEDSVYIYFNDKECGYTHVQSVFMGDYAWLPTINSGDLNSDGYPDLVIQGYRMPLRESIRILWNDGAGHFIDTNSVYVHQKEIRLKQKINVFPNPFSSTTTIQFNLNTTDISSVEIKIYDQVGEQVQHIPVKSPIEGMNTVELNMQGFPAGIYYYSLIVNGIQADTKKMVLVK